MDFALEEIKEDGMKAVTRPRFRRRGSFRRRSPGRFQRRLAQSTPSLDEKRGKFFTCGKEGHLARECRIKPRKFKTGRLLEKSVNGINCEGEEDEEINEEDLKNSISAISRMNLNEM